MSLLPEQILPITEPIGTINQETGQVTISQNWWLLLYNLSQNVLGNATVGLPASALTELASADTDAADSDAIVLRRQIENIDPPFLAPLSPGDIPDLARILQLSLDSLLPDPPLLAQPSSAISPTGSVFTYTAPFNGQVTVTAGTVSLIQIVRQGTTIATGLTTGIFPLSRADQLKVTYSGAPTMVFLPT